MVVLLLLWVVSCRIRGPLYNSRVGCLSQFLGGDAWADGDRTAGAKIQSPGRCFAAAEVGSDLTVPRWGPCCCCCSCSSSLSPLGYKVHCVEKETPTLS